MIVTGLQPTGSIHIGNYLGAIRPLVELGTTHWRSTVVLIADYHAITMPHDPVILRKETLSLAAMIVASGLSEDAVLFKQSAVPAHTELGWILSCASARMGWLNRMAQFRDKSNMVDQLRTLTAIMEEIADATVGDNGLDRVKALARTTLDEVIVGANGEGPSVGLYAYPVLQAADILLYQADSVPVGEDQSQHLNLASDIAKKFNRDFEEVFRVPNAIITPVVKRIMSLTDPTKKMSKSDLNLDSLINLTDNADTISHKIKRATSDSDLIPSEISGLDNRLGLTNMLNIYAAFRNISLDDAVMEFAGKGYGAFKPALAQAIIEGLGPIQKSYIEIMADRPELIEILDEGAFQASKIADQTMSRVRHAIGVS